MNSAFEPPGARINETTSQPWPSYSVINGPALLPADHSHGEESLEAWVAAINSWSHVRSS